MFRIAFVSLLVALAARPAGAGSILYATAATKGRIDGFCLGPRGGLARAPRTQLDLAGPQPRRLLVANGVLYVVEPDRVEAFRIPDDGRLSRATDTNGSPMSGSTKRDAFMDPRDIAVSAGTLYVTQRGNDRVAAYPLDSNGLPLPPGDFTSCIAGTAAIGYQHLVVDGTRLYVSSDLTTGNRVDAFDILPDGRLCVGALPDCTAVTPTDCPTKRPLKFEPTTPLLQRRRLLGPKSLLIMNGTLYVEEQLGFRIAGFSVADLQPPPPTPAKGEKRPKPAPPRSSTTAESLRYIALEQAGSTLIGTQFGRGRVDAYRLGSPGQKRCPTCPTTAPCCLPLQPTQTSQPDLRMSPVGLRIAQVGDQQVLYIATGDMDRVFAYRLRPDGLFASRTPFSRTDEQLGSFPNDVAVAVLSAGCP